MGAPLYARVTDDGNAILLVHSAGKDVYAFGLFDTGTGKFLWGGKASPLVGVPLVRKDELWTLARATHQDDPARGSAGLRFGVALVRHRSGEAADKDGNTGRAVFEYPVKADPKDGRFCVSPDGSHFVLVLNGDPPRLLFIPIKEGVKEKDVRVVELRAAK